MIRTCLFLLAGVYALQLSSFTTLFDLMLVTLVAFVALRSRYRARAAICFSSGLTLFVVASTQIVNSRISPQYAGDSMVALVRIIEFPRTMNSTVTFVAEPLADQRIPARIRLSWYEPPVALRLGDVWQLELRLKRPRGNSNPGVYDYEAWMFRQRILASGYVVNSNRNHLHRSNDVSLRNGIRQKFVDRLQALLPNPESAAVVAAITVGARHLLSPEQWERYARTGTSHLMAISGLHIGLAAGASYVLALLAGSVFGRGNLHDRALITSLLVAVAYAFVSGLDVPAHRAALMIVLAVVAALRRRQFSMLDILCAACIAIVILDPLASMAPGFKLSFAAVLVLLWIARRRGAGTHRVLWRPVTAIRTLVLLQILLLFGLLPLTALIFHRVALLAPFVNLIAVPVFSFVTVPLALLGLVLNGPLQFLGDHALVLAAYSVQWLEWGITRAATQAVASHVIPIIAGIAWLAVAGPLLLLLPPGWPGRYAAWIAVVALLLYRPAGPPAGCADIAVLDVGQGLSTVVRSSRHTAVFDTGAAFREGGSMGERVLLPYLSGLGIKRIDRLIVSHGDLDHAGGVADVLANMHVVDILAGEPLQTGFIPIQRCVSGQRWHWDGVDFQVLQPGDAAPAEGNDASCVLRVTVDDHALLLTGDIEQPVEHQLARAGTLRPADVVVVPHHGSRTSSTSPFVRALSPSVAIVSAGYANQWGFPKDDVVDRWRTAGAEVLNTATSGAIEVRMCALTGIESVTQYRLMQRRLWHER